MQLHVLIGFAARQSLHFDEILFNRGGSGNVVFFQ